MAADGHLERTFREIYPDVRRARSTRSSSFGRSVRGWRNVYTQRFEDMTVEESRPLLELLFDHTTKAEFTLNLRPVCSR